MTEYVHGTAVLIGATGVLIRGESGSGKSQLAFALIARGARLVADDHVLVSRCHGRVIVSAPAAIAGLIEVRGRGLLKVPCERWGVLRLIIDLARPQEIERMPNESELWTEFCGDRLPCQPIAIGDPSGPLIVETAAFAAHGRPGAWHLHSP